MTSDKLFVCSDGGLYDTSKANWPDHPLRPVFRKHFREIENTTQLKATLRAGEFTDLGGYQLYFIAQDGCPLSFEAVRDNLEQVIWSMRDDIRDGWQVVACEINYEDTDMRCEHTGKRIPSAFGDDE